VTNPSNCIKLRSSQGVPMLQSIIPGRILLTKFIKHYLKNLPNSWRECSMKM